MLAACERDREGKEIPFLFIDSTDARVYSERSEQERDTSIFTGLFASVSIAYLSFSHSSPTQHTECSQSYSAGERDYRVDV